jgi:AcrR family transcriptional regulator
MTTKPRAKHLGPERRRPLVLDAALELFVEHGYAATSMESIATAAGVTKPVVYECYPGKQILFRALLEREEDRLLSAIEAAVPEVTVFAEPESAVTASFTALLHAAAEAPSSWRVVFISEHGSDPAIAARVSEGRRRVVERLRRVIEPYLVGRGVEDAARKAPVLAEVLAAIGEAGVRFCLEHPGEWSPGELGALLGRLAMRGPDV